MYKDVLVFFMKRRSIRSYKEKPVEKEKIELILKAAMSAPSACNTQPWEFVVMTEKESIDELREKLQMARYNSP